MRKGTHGTCRTRANNILAVGFSASAVGKRGSGAYLWGYTHDDLKPKVSELACAWWHFAQKQGSYSKEKDKNCAVVHVTLCLVDDDVLDMENQQIREKFELYNQTVRDKLKGSSEEQLSQVYDMFVTDLEGVLRKNFKMVHVKVQRPLKWRYKLLSDMDISGQPSCYVVKDLTSIVVDDVEEFDYE